MRSLTGIRCYSVRPLTLLMRLSEWMRWMHCKNIGLSTGSSHFDLSRVCCTACFVYNRSTALWRASEFTTVSDLRPRQRLRSASTAALIVPATRHSTPDDRAFPVIGARLWNSLPDDITTATSLLTFRHKLKTFFFRRSYDNVDSWLLCYRFFNFLIFWFLFFSSCVLTSCIVTWSCSAFALIPR